MQKPATTEVPIDQLISNRWSPRAFNSEFVIDKKSILSLFEAARWAPSCYGDQPWKFILFQKEDITPWVSALNCLSVGNQNWAMDASILIVVCANKLFAHNNEPNRWSQYDTGASAENICLQALSLGFAAHQMGGFDEIKIRNLSNIPEQFDILSVIAVGKPLDEGVFSQEQKDRELLPRKRKLLNDIYSNNKW
ncbi:MAG: nitroreductase family protein [Methylophilales bacterium]|jgi:nitroreductase|nr:nitroreductase family protein [Pseudomonadota bacterium]NQW34412.1 nitroreductase family protein [Methylophilales bacterium]HCK04648.1 nitroreductase [Methylophilaceae bacterium]